LLNGPLPRGDRIGIISIGGGPGALTAEACEREGLTIGTLQESTLQKLDKHLPARWPRRNPVDMAGPSGSDFAVVSDLLLAVMEDDNIDVALLIAPIITDRALLSRYMGLNEEQIKAYREKEQKNISSISEKAEKYGKPVFLMWQSRGFNIDPEVASFFRNAKIIVQSNARRAARVLRHLNWYRRYLEATRGK
jgi:acetyltransferase